ncbi:hypothetical protein DSECCO2_613530 [anaerobic digester metagenome]
MQSGQLHRPEIKLLPVADKNSVFKIYSLTVVDLCIRQLLQFQRANYIVFISVRFKNIFYFHALSSGNIEVYLAVSPGIDNNGFISRTDKIRKMSQSLRLDALKYHN